MKYLSNPSNLWMERIIVAFFSIVVVLMTQDAVKERNWIALLLPLFFIIFIYFITIFNVVKYNNSTMLFENIYRVKKYKKSELARIEQGIPLTDYYKLVLKNGDTYHFRKGYSQTRFLSTRDRSKEAKQIEAELRKYIE